MLKIIISSSLGFIITFILMLVIFPMLKKLKFGQTILEYVEGHKSKGGTPTMGGISFILGIAITFFIVRGESSTFSVFAILVMIGFGIVGFLDDFLKVKLKRNLGLRAYQKIIFQLAIAVIAGVFVYLKNGSNILIPFTFNRVELHAFIIPVVVFVFIALTNSVNLTDGLDGLATKTSIMYLIPFLIIIYYKANYLLENGRPVYLEYENLYILSSIIVGALIAFLIFNSYPAKVFMGDTGSLALGGVLATIPIVSELAFFIPIIGCMFVLSSLSVIIQVLHFKRTRRRIFLMAPFHHHLEHKGIHENKIVSYYAVITLVVGLLTAAFTIYI